MRPRILIVHNRYRQWGGEDSVVENEIALLKHAGCQVETLIVSNDRIEGIAAKAAVALHTISNPRGYAQVAAAIARHDPDIVHVHNFFPRISPAVFAACGDAGIPAVWTLHNFRVACANGLLFRNGEPCEECLGRVPWPAVLHRCYRGSPTGSAAVAAMIAYHRRAGTWRHKVARFIVLSEFAREIALRAGIPAERIAIKPNFVADPVSASSISKDSTSRSGALFVGRLSIEKGVSVLIDAWRKLPDIPLIVIGDGPLRSQLEADAPANVRFAGFTQRADVIQAMQRAQALVLPSVCYENFPMTAVEAMAAGTPVIASRLGALASIVRDGTDGLHFAPGNADDLAQVAGTAFSLPDRLTRLGEAARENWRSNMSPERNLEQLLAIYQQALDRSNMPSGSAAIGIGQ